MEITKYIGQNKTVVEIPSTIEGKSVVSIGKSAFSQRGRGLTSITIPDSVKKIGTRAFSQCGKLTSINIPNGIKTLEKETFYYCTSLKSLTIPSSVTSINDHAISFCTSLTSIKLPDSVTSIENHAFYHCDNLESINIPDSVKSFGYYVFSYCFKVNINYKGKTYDYNHTDELRSEITGEVIYTVS